MRKGKRLIAFATAAFLLCASAMPCTCLTSFADETSYTVTINPTSTLTNAQVSSATAYQLFTLQSVTTSDGRAYQVSGFGSAITSSNYGSIVLALKALNITSSEENIFSSLSDSYNDTDSATLAQALAEAISLVNSDSDNAKAIAKAIRENLGESPTTYKTVSESGVITISNFGYYLIDATETDSQTGASANSSQILQVVGDTTSDASDGNVTTDIKTSYPTVDKLVSDDDEANETAGTVYGDTTNSYYETADHEIGETYYYALQATLYGDAGYSYYDVYQVTFHDYYGTGVTFGEISCVNVYVVSASDTTSTYVTSATVSVLATFSLGTNGYTLTQDTTNNTFDLKVFDLVSIVNSIDNGTTYWGNSSYNIVVEVIYSATLNEDAYVATASDSTASEKNTDANENTVTLTYSNNPSTSTWTGVGNGDTNTDGSPKGSGEGGSWSTGGGDEEGSDTPSYTTGENEGGTTEDTVFVTTYAATLFKVDTDANLITSSSATFTMTDSSSNTVYFTKSEDNVVVTYTVCASTASGATTDLETSNGYLYIVGLDAGTYTLTETVAPTGYKITADAGSIQITATHSENTGGASDNLSLSGSTVLAEGTTDTATYNSVTLKGVSLAVTNQSEDTITLPTTGGEGTVAFYGVGAILVLGAGVLLITKKRAGKLN